MIYLTTDIETSRFDLKDCPEEDQERIDEIDDEKEKQQAIDNLALNPFTSEIVCIGIKKIKNREHDKGYILMNSKEKDIKLENKGYKYVALSEKKMLEKYWNYIRETQFNKFITFNGGGFDFPYMMIRSAYLGIPIEYIQLGPDWKVEEFHIDLMKQLRFNQWSASGALTSRKLDYYTKRFLNKTSKSNEVHGKKVSILFREGKIKEIADYCVDDCEIETELYFHLKDLKLIII